MVEKKDVNYDEIFQRHAANKEIELLNAEIDRLTEIVRLQNKIRSEKTTNQ